MTAIGQLCNELITFSENECNSSVLTKLARSLLEDSKLTTDVMNASEPRIVVYTYAVETSLMAILIINKRTNTCK